MAFSFQLHEVPAPPNGVPGVTYIVAAGGRVYYTREYTRHRSLMERAGCPHSEVEWGGILDPEGRWIRRSIDFGDAPTESLRERLLRLMRSRIF